MKALLSGAALSLAAEKDQCAPEDQPEGLLGRKAAGAERLGVESAEEYSARIEKARAFMAAMRLEMVKEMTSLQKKSQKQEPIFADGTG